MGIGLIAFVILPKTPETTRILNDTERTLLVRCSPCQPR